MLLMKITVDEDPALRNEEELTDWSRRLVVMRRVAQGRLSFKILSSYRRHRGEISCQSCQCYLRKQLSIKPARSTSL